MSHWIRKFLIIFCIGLLGYIKNSYSFIPTSQQTTLPSKEELSSLAQITHSFSQTFYLLAFINAD